MFSSEKTLTAIIKCTNFAAIKHQSQRRKDPDETPYINHPIGVANLLVESGIFDVNVIQAALLHDTIEDTQTTYEEIIQHFGKQVADIVAEVTDDKNLAKEERKRLQVVNAPHKSMAAKQVKLADKLYNLRDLDRVTPQGWTHERVVAYFLWAAQVVDGCRGTNVVLEEQLDQLFAKWNVQL